MRTQKASSSNYKISNHSWQLLLEAESSLYYKLIISLRSARKQPTTLGSAHVTQICQHVANKTPCITKESLM